MIMFECGVKELKTVFNKAESLLSRRSKIETLRNILIEVNDNVYVKTTDLGSFATFKISATRFSGSGKFVVDGKQFVQTVKLLKDDVKLEYDNNILTISDTTGQTFQVKTYPLDTYYDKFPVISPSLTYSINANILAKAIDKVSYAINKDKENERRASFNYLVINGLDNKTDFVATNGYRLALYSPSSVYFSDRFKIRRDAVKVLRSFLKGVKSDVKICADGEYICFKTDNWEFITIDTCLTYPDYRYLISSYDNMKFNEFYIDKELYIGNIKYLKTFIKKEEVFALKLSITSDKAVLQIDRCREVEVKVELPIKDFKNDNSIIIGINGDFLLESLERFDGNLVKVKVIDNESPVFLESVDEKDPYMCLIATYKLN